MNIWSEDFGAVAWEKIDSILEKNPGWRLPSVKELKDAIKSEVPGFPMGDDIAWSFWSGNSDGYGKNWVVMAISGTVNNDNEYETRPVTHLRLVRSS